MKRGSLGLLVMLVSLVGTPTACKKSDPKTETPPTVGTQGAKDAAEVGNDAPAASADPWQHKSAPKDPVKKAFFWSAEKDGKTTYLLGTMHMGVDAEVRLPQIVWDRLDEAKTFAMEADVSDPKLAQTMFRSQGKLRDELGAAYWKKLEAIVGEDLAAQLDKMTVMGAAALMALKDLPKTPPMDAVLLGRAMNQKKTIVYLEEGALQAQVLAKHMSLKALKMMIDTADKGAAHSKQMLDAYLAGDPDGILKVTEEQKGDALAHGFTEAEYTAQMEDILYKRNASWIPVIEKLHASGGGFVAVGALHLIGKRSVLEMLEKRGFKITPITP